MSQGSLQRRAFVCESVNCKPPRRTFLLPGEPDRIPECENHGKMKPQPNVPHVSGRYLTGPRAIG